MAYSELIKNFDRVRDYMAYKGIDEIIAHIGPTVEIMERIIPVYDFKAAE